MKEKAEIILNGSAGVVTDILPVIDDLERAIANSAKSEDYNALKEGVELIYNKLMHILEQKGLQKISPKNEPFDTDFHEAIAMIPAPSEDHRGKSSIFRGKVQFRQIAQKISSDLTSCSR